MEKRRLTQTLAMGAVGAGLIVALAGAAGRDERPPSWAQALEQEGDHITPRELADRMLARRGDLVVVDVRPAGEFAAWHLPGALNLTVPQLLGAEGKALFRGAGDKLVVLSSNGMVHPAQAWVELARRGHANVRVLEGGLADFKREVLTPPSLRGPISETRAQAELPRFKEAEAFFLGPEPVSGGAPAAEAARNPTAAR